MKGFCFNIVKLAVFPASERIIDALLLTAYKFGVTTDKGLEISTCTSRTDISSFANTSREKAIRTLSYLKSKKYIDVTGKNIVIKDKNALIKLLNKYLHTNADSSNIQPLYPNLFY